MDPINRKLRRIANRASMFSQSILRPAWSHSCVAPDEGMDVASRAAVLAFSLTSVYVDVDGVAVVPFSPTDSLASSSVSNASLVGTLVGTEPDVKYGGKCRDSEEDGDSEKKVLRVRPQSVPIAPLLNMRILDPPPSLGCCSSEPDEPLIEHPPVVPGRQHDTDEHLPHRRQQQEQAETPEPSSPATDREPDVVHALSPPPFHYTRRPSSYMSGVSDLYRYSGVRPLPRPPADAPLRFPF